MQMCSDGIKNSHQRQRYPNAIAGLVRTGREESPGIFTKQLGASKVRIVLMSVSAAWMKFGADHTNVSQIAV